MIVTSITIDDLFVFDRIDQGAEDAGCRLGCGFGVTIVIVGARTEFVAI
jgi:hypothetical protein